MPPLAPCNWSRCLLRMINQRCCHKIYIGMAGRQCLEAGKIEAAEQECLLLLCGKLKRMSDQ